MSSFQNRLHDFDPDVTVEETHFNDLNLPMGKPVNNWTPPSAVPNPLLLGQSCKLEHLTSEHFLELWQVYHRKDAATDWTYLPGGPFHTFEEFKSWLEVFADTKNSYFYAVVDLKEKKALGSTSFMNINAEYGSIEIGGFLSRSMQRTTMSSEAFIMMARHAFKLVSILHFSKRLFITLGSINQLFCILTIKHKTLKIIFGTIARPNCFCSNIPSLGNVRPAGHIRPAKHFNVTPSYI